MSDAEGILNLGGRNGPMASRGGPVRAVNTTFVVNAARPALVCYSVRVAPGANGQGRVDLLSDYADPPTTLLASVGFAAGGGGGLAPAVIGAVDGVTVPGTPTFTGSGIVSIAENGGAAGYYDLVLSAPLNLAAGGGAQGVLLVGPSEIAGGPTGLDATSFYLNVTDPTHISIRGYSTAATVKDWKAGITIWPIASGGGGSSGSVDVMVSGIVFAGQNVRIGAVAVAGAPAFTVLSASEYIL